MKNFVAFIAMVIFATTVSAENWKDPESRFDTSKNFTAVSTIRWQVTDNVQKNLRGRKSTSWAWWIWVQRGCMFVWEGSSCII
jgi:hypothetical protein